MIEFVGLPPILQNHIRGCHGNHMKSDYIVFIILMISLIFSVFINVNEYANYANMITCIIEHGLKGLSMS